jgi:hypothetical protein
MAATITYPIAVRIARSRLFKLRNFYSIHLAIAPFLALVHVNIIGFFYIMTKIKFMECKINTIINIVIDEFRLHQAEIS